MAVPHPRHGEVSFHTRQLHGGLLGLCTQTFELMCAIARLEVAAADHSDY